jgi:hypothetical protein
MLQPGDVLFFAVTPQAPIWDRAIGWGERMLKQSNSDKKNYYHVAFVSEDTTKMWSAQPPWIDLYDIPTPLPDYIEVYRPIRPLVPGQLLAIFSYAESVRHTLYNFLGVLTAGYIQVGHFLYCSQFTWIAYSQAGFFFCGYEFLESPDDLVKCPPLKLVTP